MFKCPACEYTSETAGTCPTDNSTLVEVEAATPETTESAPVESTPEATPTEETAS